jgi:putative Mg2+ transporter-C (MgtC) family protein
MTLPTISDLWITLEIGLAGILGSVLGWQRFLVGRPAGVRTHALVAMASAIFTLVGIYGFSGAGPHDVTRIAAQVVTGVGFLGAGTIFRAQDRVVGLTTAATLWFSAGLGILIGAGLTWVAIFATGLGLLFLILVRLLEHPPD